MTKQQWIQLATVILLPLAMALMKRFAPLIPKKYIPIACPIIGAVIDVISGNGFGANTSYGVMAGMAAVGLREVYDQISGNAAKTDDTTKPTP
jgi:cell shape-determining protein MreD